MEPEDAPPESREEKRNSSMSKFSKLWKQEPHNSIIGIFFMSLALVFIVIAAVTVNDGKGPYAAFAIGVTAFGTLLPIIERGILDTNWPYLVGPVLGLMGLLSVAVEVWAEFLSEL